MEIDTLIDIQEIFGNMKHGVWKWSFNFFSLGVCKLLAWCNPWCLGYNKSPNGLPVN